MKTMGDRNYHLNQQIKNLSINSPLSFYAPIKEILLYEAQIFVAKHAFQVVQTKFF